MTVRGANYPRKPNDFYATPPETTRALLHNVDLYTKVCDPACGDGAILRVLHEYGYKGIGNDLKNGYDFLTSEDMLPECDILTNPPFGTQGRLAVKFIKRALEITKPYKRKVAMLLPVDFDSARTRQDIFRFCPAFAMKVVLLNRIRWFNGQSGSLNHAWFVWDHKNTSLPRIRYASQEYPIDLLT